MISQDKINWIWNGSFMEQGILFPFALDCSRLIVNFCKAFIYKSNVDFVKTNLECIWWSSPEHPTNFELNSALITALLETRIRKTKNTLKGRLAITTIRVSSRAVMRAEFSSKLVGCSGELHQIHSKLVFTKSTLLL